MRCSWNEEEDVALQGTALLAQIVYLRGLRRFMDYESGLVGLKRGISYQQIREVCYVEPGQGRRDYGSPTIEAIRNALKILANAGLVEKRKCDRRLVFFLPFASLDESAQNKCNRRATDVQQTKRNTKKQNKNNEEPEKHNIQRSGAYPERCPNPPVSGNRIKRTDKSVVENSPKNGEKSPAVEIFEYWRTTMQKTAAAKLNAKRLKAINARLGEGYSVDDVKIAIDGCAASGWHQGKNGENKKYDDLELICRDGARLEQFKDIATQNSRTEAELDDWLSEDKILDGEFSRV